MEKQVREFKELFQKIPHWTQKEENNMNSFGQLDIYSPEDDVNRNFGKLMPADPDWLLVKNSKCVYCDKQVASFDYDPINGDEIQRCPACNHE
jgi:hypothetical protein